MHTIKICENGSSRQIGRSRQEFWPFTPKLRGRSPYKSVAVHLKWGCFLGLAVHLVRSPLRARPILMLFYVAMVIQIMLVAYLYSQKELLKNYISALIAVGRDISRGRTYRNSRILSSDLTPGNRLITWDSEENKIEWVTTPGQAKSREYVIQQNFDLIIPGHP